MATGVLWGCGKDVDGSTNSTGYWVNNTIHSIQISPYRMGAVRKDYVVYLEPGDSLKIADASVMGKP